MAACATSQTPVHYPLIQVDPGIDGSLAITSTARTKAEAIDGALGRANDACHGSYKELKREPHIIVCADTPISECPYTNTESVSLVVHCGTPT